MLPKSIKMACFLRDSFPLKKNLFSVLKCKIIILITRVLKSIPGYYADQLSIRSEIRGNSTVNIKNESRGFHLNNLSYAGPIVMGVGGK